MATPPKTAEDIARAGGRHYRGAGLGKLQAWICPACGTEQGGRFESGCTKCGAGKPGIVKTPDAPLVGGPSATAAPRPSVPSAQPRGSRSLSEQLRHRGPAVDYDEIEARMARVLEARLGGGYSDAERVLLYQGLEALLWLIENNEIELPPGQTVDQVRALAQKVAPDEGLETEYAPSTTAPTETGNTEDASPGGEYAPDDTEHDAVTDAIEREQRGGTAGFEPVPRTPSAAPQFLDVDHRGDESGEDDPHRHGR